MFSTTQQPPHLLLNLQIALSTLYSLPTNFSHHGKEGKLSCSQAHDFLLQFQARNPRRDLHSKQSNQKQNQQQIKSDSSNVGSTWLACVAVLSSLPNNTNSNSTKVHHTEALFAAQTLVHRLRRTKLSEAIDIEFEPYVVDSSLLVGTNPNPEKISSGYQKWVLQYYHGASTSSSFGILLQLMSTYRPGIDPQQNNTDLEERIKGEISMIVIASIMDVLTKSSLEQAQQQTVADIFAQGRPLLKTMASILALIAARIRYTSKSLPSPAPHTQPMVTTILGAISMFQSREHEHHQHSNEVQESAESLSFTCLTALPEAILTGNSCNGNVGGGAYGRFSLDPRCYAAVTAELKTQGMNEICLSIQNMLNAPNRHSSPIFLFQMCEAWAKYVSLPIDFLSATVPLVIGAWEQFRFSQPSRSHAALQMKSAMAYWIAIMEGGTWSVDQVLTSSLVQSKESSRQPNKKKQSSRSKKRHHQFLEENTTNELLSSASKEVDHRGRAACTMAQQTLPVLKELLIYELRRISESDIRTDDREEDFQGGGPVGAITACADACLPYLLRTSVLYEDTTSMAMFTMISNLIQEVCASPSRLVRSFVAESLYSLHEALVKTLTDHQNKRLAVDFLEMVINHFWQSSFNLAFRCGYPPGFFDDLGQDNDEELESERNDVRDLLRTICGIPTSVSGINSPSLIYIASSILLRLMQACAQSVREAAASNSLFPELALHTFSALAKPINSAAILYVGNVEIQSFEKNIATIVNLALEIASNAGTCLLLAFPVVSMNEVLPLSRLYNLAISSLAPMFSALCQIHSTKQAVENTLKISINAAATSLLKLPELTGPSSLRQTRFDIRGAMRSPGGEDHVGVLTLMRLVNESEQLSLVFLRSNDSIIAQLCEIHETLKAIEDQRGVGVFYGIGVLPKSRRILLNVICDLEVIPGANNQASRLLTVIFEKAITSIVSAKPQLENLGSESLSRICESTFDIAAFSPNMILPLLISNSDGLQALFLHVLHTAGNFGFLLPHDSGKGSDVIIAWNRLRAALFMLLKKIGNPDLPSSIAEILISFIRIECEAAILQCSEGPLSSSRIFHEDVISEESIPPGVFIRAIVETFDRAFTLQVPISLMSNTLYVLYTTRHHVMRILLAECPMPVQKGSFYDPRPIIAETWFQCMNRIAKTIGARGSIEGVQDIKLGISSVSSELLVETFVVTITLLLYTSLGKTQQKRANDPGMSLDGPQGLVMMEFFVLFISLGLSRIQAGARKLASIVPVIAGDNADEAGMAIIGAAFFRGSQGGLPPWAVESVPSIYSSLFGAFNKDVNTFGRFLEISMVIRLSDEKCFGGVQSGSLLSGKFFGKMTEKTKLDFIHQAKDIARIDTTASWRRFKTLIKQACGGKKKDTDFKQRPALTTWDTLDRV